MNRIRSETRMNRTAKEDALHGLRSSPCLCGSARGSLGYAVLVLACVIVLLAGVAAAETATPTIRIEGNRDVKQSALMKQIVLEFDDAPSGQRWTVAADDATFAIESLYRERGYPFAQVAFQREAEGPSPGTVTFRIDEGPRILVRTIAFDGNKAFEDAILSDLVLDTWPPRPKGAVPYIQDNVRRGANEIAAYYYDRGYLAASVAAPEVSLDRAAGYADVRYAIEEGPQHRVASVSVVGPPPDFGTALDKIAKTYEGKAYTPRMADRLAALIEEHLANRGYPDVRVEPREETDAATGRVRLRMDVHSGELVTLSGVDVTGNRVTIDDFIRSRVKLALGAPYDRQAERKTFQSLYRTGLFRTVTLELKPDEGSDRRLEVGVVEAPSREIFVEPGYGSYELFRVRLGLRHRNLFGRGKGFRAEGIAAVRAQKATLGFTDPSLLGTELLADYPVYWERRKEPSFTSQEYGLAPSVTWRISETLSLTGIYRLKSSEATQVDVSEEAAGDNTFRTSSATLSPLFDSRDSFFVPRRGMLVHPSLEWAAAGLGSELQFLRIRHRQSHFFPLSSRTVLAILLQTGVIIPQGNTETIPIQERFFNGGENTVRSFLEGELGPRDEGGDPLGGKTFTAVSAEIRQDLVHRWQIAAFVDAGNVLPAYEDYGSFDNFRYGIGLGLRYILPVGPIRVDAALNPSPRDGEDNYAVHFSVGMAF